MRRGGYELRRRNFTLLEKNERIITVESQRDYQKFRQTLIIYVVTCIHLVFSIHTMNIRTGRMYNSTYVTTTRYKPIPQNFDLKLKAFHKRSINNRREVANQRIVRKSIKKTG